jgi:DNA-binding MarR family transcriptional regulator
MPTRTPPVLDLERYAPALLTFLANKLTHTASLRYRREFGVGIIDWRIIALLAIEPCIPATRICRVIGLDKGPVSRSLALLEGKGLAVARADGSDGRRRLLSLTRTGRALHDRILPAALERERRLLSCLAPTEVDTLLGLLNRLHSNLDMVTRGEDAHAARPTSRRAKPASAASTGES